MNIAKFNTSLSEVEKILKKTDLFRQKGIKSINDSGVSDEFKEASQKLDYFAAYKAALRNFDYDFLLKDESIFQFEFKPNPALNGFPDIRYSFFQNPQEFRTYKEFLLEQELVEEEHLDEELPPIFQEEYEQFLIEQQLNQSSVTFRFDADLGNYRPSIHSVAHIHIGHSNDIRIPCDKLLTPEKFLIFVLKNAYYHLWREFIETENRTIQNCLINSKNQCSSLLRENWNDDEKKELFIT